MWYQVWSIDIDAAWSFTPILLFFCCDISTPLVLFLKLCCITTTKLKTLASCNWWKSWSLCSFWFPETFLFVFQLGTKKFSFCAFMKQVSKFHCTCSLKAYFHICSFVIVQARTRIEGQSQFLQFSLSFLNEQRCLEVITAETTFQSAQLLCKL